jgi:hypothetical protein
MVIGVLKKEKVKENQKRATGNKLIGRIISQAFGLDAYTRVKCRGLARPKKTPASCFY